MIDDAPINGDDMIPPVDSNQNDADVTDSHPLIGDGMPRTDAEYGARLQSGIVAADKKYRLRARDRLFLLYYLDKSNPDTYLKCGAALRKANADRPLAYHVRASQILGRLRRVGAYDLILNTIGAGVEVRLHLLADIASGDTESVEVKTSEKGVTRTVKQPTFRERIAALQELNRMDGTYGKLKAVAKVQGEVAKDEYNKLREQARKAIADVGSGRRIAPDRTQTRKAAPIDAEVVTEQDRAEDAI